jgi:hypothetical protein
MFKINFLNKQNKQLLSITKKYFQMMSTEEYLINMKESLKRLNVESCKLQPLPQASNL